MIVYNFHLFRFVLLLLGMTDVHSKETRSFNMSQIRGKNTKPEMVVRKFLFANEPLCLQWLIMEKPDFDLLSD
jgi:hypothetical protein